MQPSDLNRRAFLRYLALLGLCTFSAAPLAAKDKIPKKYMMYQETPKNGQKCVDCIQFLPETNECKVIAGPIEPEGWCRLFVPINA